MSNPPTDPLKEKFRPNLDSDLDREINEAMAGLSIEQLERSVLFQLMVGANVRDEVREEIADAVALTLANRTPLPSEDPSQPRRPPRRKARPNQPPRRRTGGGAASRGRRRH